MSRPTEDARHLPQISVPARFTGYRVGDPGITAIYSVVNRWQRRLDVEAALAVAQAEVGMIPAEAADAISSAASDVTRLDLDRVVSGTAAMSHPLMALIVELSRAVGDEHGGWVHWGATTQNISQTADVSCLRDAHGVVRRLLHRVLTAGAALAERYAGTAMAGRTHGQHAVPITFGYKVAVWLDALVRQDRRLVELEEDVFTSMAGGAVGNFAAMGPAGPEVHRRMARHLGLVPMRVPSRSTADAFASYVSCLAVLASVAGTIGREIYTLMKPELGEVFEPVPDGAVGSSTMPHKRNPQLTQDIVGLAAEVRSQVPLALDGLAHDHEVDGAATASMDRALEHGVTLVGDQLLRLALVLEGLEVDEDRMRENLAITEGLISSEAVMMELAPEVGRQVAHDLVYAAAQAASASGTPFARVLRADPRLDGMLTDEQLDRLLDPTRHVGQSPEVALDLARIARSHVTAQEAAMTRTGARAAAHAITGPPVTPAPLTTTHPPTDHPARTCR